MDGKSCIEKEIISLDHSQQLTLPRRASRRSLREAQSSYPPFSVYGALLAEILQLKLPAARPVDELRSSYYGECALWSIFNNRIVP